jgi:hypothetical protein
VSLRGLPLGGHLGPRVSALLDGQLSEADSERAWAHLAHCRDCQQQVERESWIKRRVAGLCFDGTATASDSLKDELSTRPTWCDSGVIGERRHRHAVGLAALGGSAVGAAVMGFLAFGAAPADAPTTPQPRLAAYSTPLTPVNVTSYRLPR